MKRNLRFTGILAAALLTAFLFFTACQKDNSPVANDPASDAETQLATEDDAEADMTYDDVFVSVMGTDDEVGIGTGIGVFGRTAGDTDPGSTNRIDSAGNHCFTVTRVPAAPGVFPKTVTIDFGTGCTGPDGHTRRGKIITVYSGRLIVPGSEAVTTFDNYYIDSVHVEGRHKVANNSTSAVRVFTRTVINGKLTKPSGNYVKWDATHTSAQTAGLGTPLFPLDDEFDVTGGGTGQYFRNGNTHTWSRLIITPLHKKFTCNWIESGIVKIDRNGTDARLNFGNGNCDNQAVLTIGGNHYNITLH